VAPVIGVFIDGVRIGTVTKFVGHPPATRWIAWAPRLKPDEERRQGFPTRKEAIAWLAAIHEAEGTSPRSAP
jgi:hypothetical protein